MTFPNIIRKIHCITRESEALTSEQWTGVSNSKMALRLRSLGFSKPRWVVCMKELEG